MGLWYSVVFQYAPSPSEVSTLQTILNIDVYQVSHLMGVSLGIYLPGRASHIQSNFFMILLSVMMSHYLFHYYYDDDDTLLSRLVSLVVGIIIAFFTIKSRQHNKEIPKPQSIIWRWFKVSTMVLFFWMAVIRSIYHHGTINVHDPITNTMTSKPIHELLSQLWTSQFIQQTIFQPIQYFYHHPFTTPLYDDYYTLEERNAYHELEMNHCTIIGTPKCDTKHIKRQFYKLSKLYHPDKIRTKHTTEQQQQINNEKMFRLNHAYELLLQRFKQQQQ